MIASTQLCVKPSNGGYDEIGATALATDFGNDGQKHRIRVVGEGGTYTG